MLNYTLSGVTAAEVVGGQLSGTVTVAANGSASIPVSLLALPGEGLSGSLTATLSVPSNLSSPALTVASVSLVETAMPAGPPVPLYTLTAAASSATEGSIVAFHVATYNVAAGTVLNYSLTGVTTSEVVGGQLAGSVTVAADGTANIPVTLTGALGQGLSGNLTAVLAVPAGASSGSVTTASIPLDDTGGGGVFMALDGGTYSTALTGGVTIGNATTGLTTDTLAVTVTDLAATGLVSVFGGAGVTVTTFSSGGVVIGTAAGTPGVEPSGAVTVTDNALTGAVNIFGGAGVTVSTASTGGVTVGTTIGTHGTEPSGAVTITDTALTGAVDVNGGAAVNITTTSTSAIAVGVSGTIAADPTGAVTVTNLISPGVFGAAPATIFTNGGNTVTVTGTSGATITDASATHLLATVTLDGVGGTTTISTGNTLLSLSVLDGASSSRETVVDSAGHVLALTIGSVTVSPAYANITDSTATSITATTTPTTAVEHLTLSAAAATSITLGAHTAGTDQIQVGTITTAHGSATTGVTITGAAVGDSVQFTDVATSIVAAGTLTGASLAAVAATVDAMTSTVAHSATIFTYVGNTYVLESVAAGTGTLQTGDSIVELVGTHTLSAPAAGIFHLLT